MRHSRFLVARQRRRRCERAPDGERETATRLLYPTGTQADMLAALSRLGQMHLCPLKIEQKEPSLESLFMEAAAE